MGFGMGNARFRAVSGRMMRALDRLAWCFLPLLVLGCDSVTEGVSLSLAVNDGIEPGVPAVPLEGATICETGTANCVITDAQGRATLLLPPDEEISYTVEKDGYERTLFVDVTDGAFLSEQTRTLWPDELVAEWYEALRSQYPPTDLGTVFVTVNRPPFPGATFDLLDATGKAFYEEEFFRPRLDLEATTEASTGGFVEVPPGEREVALGGTAQGCTVVEGWPGSQPNRIRLPVVAGVLTAVVVACPRP
jgi:hypothetical protein